MKHSAISDSESSDLLEAPKAARSEHPESRTYFVLEPKSDQAQVLMAFLGKYQQDAIVIGLDRADDLLPSQLKGGSRQATSEREASDAHVIPTGAKSTSLVLRYSDVVLGSATLSQEAIRVYDKPWIIEVASSLGIPVPRTDLSHRDIREFPVFYKQREESGGGIRGVAKSLSELPQNAEEQLIFQEYIESSGTYGVALIADKGSILTFHMHFERESFPEAGGSAVVIESFHDDRLLRYTSILIDSLSYSGWGLAEFKYCPKREDFVFMEINAKFWASCEFSFVNEPAFLNLLFDIESKERRVERMIFLDRAFQRGPVFLIRSSPTLLRGGTCRIYRGWMRKIIIQLMPASLSKLVKKIKCRGTTTVPFDQ
jgi:hypothetical protein